MSEVILAEGLQNPEEQVLKRENLTEKDFKKIIRQMGLKVTQQRLVILETLAEGRVHVTAQEVFEIVNDKFPEMGFATVYRFLRKLTENNFVTEVRMGGLPARYELTPKRHHDHLTCVQCGKIVEFENQEMEQLPSHPAIPPSLPLGITHSNSMVLRCINSVKVSSKL